MVCSQCGSNVADEAVWCPECGTQQMARQGAQQTQYGARHAVSPQPGPARPEPVSWQSAARRDPASAAGARPDSSTGGGASPFPAAEHPAFRFEARRWTRNDRITGIATVALMVCLFLPWFGVNILGISATADGVTVHGYLYLVLIVALAIVAYLVVRAGFDELPVRLPLAHSRLLLVATGLNFVLVLLAFVTKPGLSSWQYGAFAALAAALAAAAPVASSAVGSRRNPA